MRIGIVTIHHATNYGAVWQAYALSRTLRGNGHTVEIIDYRPPIAVRFYQQRFGQDRRPNIRSTLKLLSFQRFIRRKLPLGRTRCANAADLTAASRHYDTLIAGSDQIWCTGLGSFRGYDSNFFLDFCQDPNVRKISYAASAGNTKDFAEHSLSIRDSLQTFSALSVRDEPTAALVGQASGRNPVLVLDPTLIHDFSEVVGDVKLTNDLIVFADQPNRFETLAAETAKKHGLRTVSIGVPCRAADLKLRVVSPVSWLRRIKGARAVLTDFFHGTALALRFGRPLVVGASPGKRNKITDLLRRADLMHLFLDENESKSDALDHALENTGAFSEEIERKLGNHRSSSLAFLSEALLPAVPAPTR